MCPSASAVRRVAARLYLDAGFGLVVTSMPFLAHLSSQELRQGVAEEQ